MTGAPFCTLCETPVSLDDIVERGEAHAVCRHCMADLTTAAGHQFAQEFNVDPAQLELDLKERKAKQ